MKAITNKSNPAVVADFSSPLVASKGEVKGYKVPTLRPSVPWRRPASDRESDVKLSGSVMKRDNGPIPGRGAVPSMRRNTSQRATLRASRSQGSGRCT